MLYAVLCYNEEQDIQRWTPEQDAACMTRLSEAQAPFEAAGRLGPVARLDFTGAATTLRKTSGDPVVHDGPFAETKEQLLGFYVIDANSMIEAQDFARQLARANPGAGSYEIRPLRYLKASRGEHIKDMHL
ncbi:MAG: YciI family protein [Caulobacteraceae bacterium]|nr:YciI family protein [Caulobacteraceae bacterium]